MRICHRKGPEVMNGRLCRIAALSPSPGGKRFVVSAAIATGMCGALFLGVAGTAQAAPRDCSEVPQQTAIAAGAGAAGGAAIGGPPGGIIGAGLGTLASWVGGCTVTIPGTPHPVAGS